MRVLVTWTPVAGVPPNVTEAPTRNPVPVMAKGVPPVVGPDRGAMPVAVGGVLSANLMMNASTLPPRLESSGAPPPPATGVNGASDAVRPSTWIALVASTSTA